MTARKVLEYGGIVAGVVLIAFGIGALAMSVSAHNTVSDQLTQQKIVGTPDMNPADTEAAMKEAGLATVSVPSCNVANEAITTGTEARCFADYMRIHALESTGGLVYAEMGRFIAKADPKSPAGTDDAAAALTDENGQPVANGARNTWVTATALTTALNMSYMAQQLSLFGLVVGIALLLSGIGFLILAVIVLGTKAAARQGAAAPASTPAVV